MIRPDDVILFQGDSITDCHRSRDDAQPNGLEALGQGYAMITAATLLLDHPDHDLCFFNRGASGDRIVDLAARWKVDTLKLEPTVISILIGVNDTWHAFGDRGGVTVEQYDQVYHDLLTQTRKALPDIRLILCEPFVLRCGVVTDQWMPEMHARQQIVRNLADTFDATFVPFQAAFDDAAQRALPEYWAADGVHPTAAGHMLMARTWLRAVCDNV